MVSNRKAIAGLPDTRLESQQYHEGCCFWKKRRSLFAGDILEVHQVILSRVMCERPRHALMKAKWS